MKPGLKEITISAIISFLVVAPFMVMELINRKGYPGGFPFPLFIFLWVLGFFFCVMILSIIRSRRQAVKASATAIVVKVVFIILTAGIWVRLIVDQMPCFLGFQNCD